MTNDLGRNWGWFSRVHGFTPEISGLVNENMGTGVFKLGAESAFPGLINGLSLKKDTGEIRLLHRIWDLFPRDIVAYQNLDFVLSITYAGNHIPFNFTHFPESAHAQRPVQDQEP